MRSLSLLIVLGLSAPAGAQTPEPTLFRSGAAAWIAHPKGPGRDTFAVFHFRRSFEIEAVPESFTVHVSADNRYRLFLNGELVSSGPQRSDLMHWRYETVDLAPQLRSGRNVLAALVWNWGAQRPVAQFSHASAFLLQGDTDREATVNTGPEWRVFYDTAYAPLPVDRARVGGYYASPPGESIDARRYPWGWTGLDFLDESWPMAVARGGSRSRATHAYGEADGRQLMPRSIPPMEQTPIHFARVRRTDGIELSEAFLRGTGDLVVPAQTRAVLLLDQEHLTNAFAVLEASGGAGTRLAIVYAEALKDARGDKGNRNEIEGKTLTGVRDEFLLDGGARRRFQTLWFRTYRYVQLEIQTADEALRLHDLHGIFVAYPFELKAKFTSDLPWLAEMWKMNWRGARLCAWETYFDTPYYEQLQYVGDTRIQALITLAMSDDDRLVRQAIEHFDLSRGPEGLTASRYPSDPSQFIPTFSLLWIAMLHDYWMHRDAVEYIRGFLPGVRGVLAWFEERIDGTGMIGPLAWWPYVDWANEWQAGVPPGGRTGHSTVISLQFVYALQRAAALENALGLPAQAARYRDLAQVVRDAARARTWNPERRLFRDAPGADSYSQQANVMAVLADAVGKSDQTDLIERVLTDPSLTQSSYYFSFYQLEALLKAGLGDRYIEQLAPWRGMLALGLTTTPERPEPTRSDSHAWSAHPNYGLLATVLGIRPAAPGFASVRIAPHLGPLRRAERRLPHPLGPIEVRLERTRDGGLCAEVELPPGLDGVFVWQDEEARLRGGRQTLECPLGRGVCRESPRPARGVVSR